MVDTPITGALNYVQYGWESTYGSPAGTIDKAFGHDVTLTANPKNNVIPVQQIGRRNVSTFLSGKYDGSLSIEFTLGNSYWMKALFGAVSDAGTNPTTHTFTEANTLPSMTLEAGYDMGTTDVVRKFLGVKINTATITAAVGETIRVKLECLYQKELGIGTSLDTTPATDTIDPMVFHQGSLQFPDATDISRVQNIECTFDNGLIVVSAIGQRYPSAIIEGPRKYSGRVTHTFENSTAFLSSFGTGQSSATLARDIELTLTNGLSAANTREIVIRLGTTTLDNDSIMSKPNELTNEDVDFQSVALDLCTAKDNVAATP